MKKDNTRPDPREAEMVENMLLDNMEHIYGEGLSGIEAKLGKTVATAETLSKMVYRQMKRTVLANQKKSRVSVDMDMALGVTTDTIDMLTELAVASGNLQSDANLDKLKEEVLLRVVTRHGAQLGEPTPEVRAEAQADMRDYMADQGTAKAFDHVAKRANEEGTNVNDMIRRGNEMMYGSRNPLADAISKGVRGPDDKTPLMPGFKPPTHKKLGNAGLRAVQQKSINKRKTQDAQARVVRNAKGSGQPPVANQDLPVQQGPQQGPQQGAPQGPQQAPPPLMEGQPPQPVQEDPNIRR